MLIGLISDTHDNNVMSKKAINIFNEREMGLVLHGGDYIAPFNFREFRRLAMRMVGVFGNNDGERIGLYERFKLFCDLGVGPREVEHQGYRFLLMHEPAALDALIDSERYDAVIYGHTHQVDVRKGKTLIINPGECGGWLTGRATIAILDVERKEVEVIEL